MRILNSLVYPKFRIRKRARKITLQYDGANFNVVSDRQVSMAPPPSDPIADHQTETGFWVSVSDNNGRVLYRRVMQSPQTLGAEVYTKDPAETLFRVGAGAPTILEVVIPDMAEGMHLRLFGSSTDAEGHLMPATQILHYPLTKESKKEANHGLR